jgi:sugar transferase (PEP-CTERM/EpsH1 system associated)
MRDIAPQAASRIHAMKNGVDTEYFSPAHTFENPFAAGERAMVFTGAMDYWPNVDAVQWFADHLYPSIAKACPQASFWIVGARPSPSLERLKKLAGVTVTGSVPDVRPYLAHAALAVAPLRIARGTQNKVLEAMAMGIAVVASTNAAAGIDAAAGRDFLVAEDEAAFIDACRHVLGGGSPELGQAARARVLADYSWDANLALLETLLDSPAAAAAASAPARLSVMSR